MTIEEQKLASYDPLAADPHNQPHEQSRPRSPETMQAIFQRRTQDFIAVLDELERYYGIVRGASDERQRALSMARNRLDEALMWIEKALAS